MPTSAPINPLGQALHGAVTQPLVHSVQSTFAGQTFAFAKLTDMAGDFATTAMVALFIMVVTGWASTWAARLVRAAFKRVPGQHRDETLSGFVASLVRYTVLLIGGIAILNRLGFQTTSIITVLGAASLAVGLALQGALSNVAAGVMVLLFRPYRVGDYVTIAGKSGTVRRLDLFNTELSDPDGLKLVVPNAKGFGDVMTNYTDIPQRRFELSLRVPFETDFDLVTRTLMATMTADPRVKSDPAPWAGITDVAADAVIATLRCWAPLDVYWDTRYALTARAIQDLRAAGVTVAYPAQAPAPARETAPAA